MRRPLTTPDQRDVPERKPGRLLEPAQRHVPDKREDLVPEGGEVGELAIALVPLSRLPFAFDICRGPSAFRLRTVGRIDISSMAGPRQCQ
jgi:hypothetical protein